MKHAYGFLAGLALIVTAPNFVGGPQDDLKKLAEEVAGLRKDIGALQEKIDAMAKQIAEIKTAVASRTDRATRYACATNLSQLIKGVYNYSVTKTPVEGSFHDDVDGKAWILRLYEDTPGKEVKDPKVFWCPNADPPGEGKTSYWGYKNTGNKNGTVNQCPGDMPVMCDDPANHPDGIHVALKSGSVRWAAKDSELYKLALENCVP